MLLLSCQVFNLFFLGIFFLAHLFLYLVIGFFQSAFSAKQYDIYDLCCNLSFFTRSKQPAIFGEKNSKKQDKITDQINKDRKGKDEMKVSVPILLRKFQVLFYTAGEIRGDRSITDYIF